MTIRHLSKYKFSILPTLLYLSLSLTHFFIGALVILDYNLFFLSFIPIGLLLFTKSKAIKSTVIIYLLVMILVFVVNDYYQIFELFYYIRNFILLNIFIGLFVTKISESTWLHKGLMYIIIFELILFFVSFYFTSLSFFPNNSLFGILIASQFAFVAPFINSLIENHKTADLNKTILKLVTIAFCAFVLIATAGSAELAGFAIALLIMNLKRFWKLPRLKKIIIIISSILFLCLLLFAKPDSSKGRLLIYKVVLN